MAEAAIQLRVFLSHSSADSAFCREIVQALRNAGADVWYDEHNLGSGVLRREIMRELSTRQIFLVVLSKAAFASSWVQDECEWVYNLYRRKPQRLILPITAGTYDQGDFDTMLYLESMRRIEAAEHNPYSMAEAVRRLLRVLALPDVGEMLASLAPQPSEDVGDLLTRGRALIARHKDAEALTFIERAIQLAPDSFDIWAIKGDILGKLGCWQEALLAYDRALACDDKQAYIWGNKSGAFASLKRYEEALAACDRGLDLNPNDADLWVIKAATLTSIRHYQEAVTAADRAIFLDPNLAAAWNNKGYALACLKHYEEALAAFDRAVDLDPNYANAWFNQGNAFYALGCQVEAMEACNHALAIDPSDADSWFNRGTALYNLRRYQEALADIERGFDPNDARDWQVEAYCLSALGRIAEAEAAETHARALGRQR